MKLKFNSPIFDDFLLIMRGLKPPIGLRLALVLLFENQIYGELISRQKRE